MSPTNTNTNFGLNAKQLPVIITSLLLFLLLLFFTFTNCYKWIDKPFYGFLVMKNQVVASISLPHWEGTRDGEIFQSKVIEIDGHPIQNIRDFWNRLEHYSIGESISYTFIKDGHAFNKQIPVTFFSYKDFLLLFGLYLLNGIAFFLIGLSVYLLRPKSSSGLALFAVGSTIGIFTLTACDLYFPYWFFRLHVLGEAFLSAAVFHLTLTFPQEKKWLGRTYSWILLAYLLSLSLGISYEIWLFSHRGYVIIHNLCSLYFGTALLFFVFSMILSYYRTRSTVIRYKIRTVMWGTVFALFLPSIIVIYSALKLGEVAINSIALTTFVFPLALGYAIIKRNLLEIDKIIQRSLYYLVFSGLIIVSYIFVVYISNTLFQGINPTNSPYFIIPLILLIIFLLNPLKERVQRFVDRTFYHINVDYQKILGESSTSLTTLLYREHICRHIIKNITEIISPEMVILMGIDEEKKYYIPLLADGFESDQIDNLKIEKENWLVARLQERQKELTVFEIENFYKEKRNSDVFFSFLIKMKTQIIIPLIFKNEIEAFLIVGRKKSGFNYHSKEFEFLRTLINQATLSLVNAKSYDELKKAQRELVHNEKLKLVGEMANMIVHDFKGPMTTIRCSAEFLEIDSLPKENREKYCKKIMKEVDRLVNMSKELTEFSSGNKKILRDSHSVRNLVEDIKDSLEEITQKNRINFITNLKYEEELVFDYEKLKRVIFNLAYNAIAAMSNGGTLTISNQFYNKSIEFLIKDTGKGIPQRFVNKIFDPFFTYGKSEGTGLGLCIVKDIINNHGGDIWVTSEEGRGTTFYFTIPLSLNERVPESSHSFSQSQFPMHASDRD